MTHSWADPAPQVAARVAALVTDAFAIFPWDREVLVGGRWLPHPEIEAGVRAQGEDGS